MVLLSHDATNSIALPRLGNRPLKDFTKGGMLFTPWLITNHGRREKEYIYAPKGKWAKGANYILTQLQAMVRRIKSDVNNPQHKARRLVIIADNASENKNSTLLAWASDMVQAFWFDSVEFLFGEVGHTHNGNDATHKVHNQDLGRYESGDLGQLVWNYRFPWSNAHLRPRASVLDVMYDWDEYYNEDYVRPLAGYTKTAADKHIVRGFKISRGMNKLVDVKWKADPAMDKYWRGDDGNENSEGFYILSSVPPGVPQKIEPAVQLQATKYANHLQKKGLKTILGAWQLANAVEHNYNQIMTGVISVKEQLEPSTPLGEWGPLCKIGSHDKFNGNVRFIQDVLSSTNTMWDLPDGLDAATSLRYHVSGDADELETRPLPNVGYRNDTNGKPLKAKNRPMFDHPNNAAERNHVLLEDSNAADIAADAAFEEESSSSESGIRTLVNNNS